MSFALSFSLDPEPEREARALERLKEVFDLVNMDKEEQAIDPDNFGGNLPDYPAWLREAFLRPELIQELELFCEFDPGELKGWDVEAWYEELCDCDAFNYQLQAVDEPGRHLLTFEAADEHYGGDIAHAWILLAAGGEALESRNESMRPQAGQVVANEDSIDPEELGDLYDSLEDNTDAKPDF